VANKIYIMRKEQKSTIVLPQLRDITLIQPTRVTYAKKAYNNIHNKLLTYVIYELQEHIRRTKAGEQIHQLDIFKANPALIEVNLCMDHVGRPDQYNYIRKCAIAMCGIVIKIDDLEKKEVMHTGLFAAVIEKEPGTRTNILRIQIREEIAKLLIKLDWFPERHGQQAHAGNFTEYQLRPLHMFKNKYSDPVYKLISSWKDKVKFCIKIEDFKAILGIKPEQYTNYAHFKKRVLLPVQAELRAHADCWFNVGSREFETVKQKKVTHLNFVVMSEDSEITLAKQKEICKVYIRDTFRMSVGYMKELEPMFDGATLPTIRAIMDKAHDLKLRYDQEKKNINNMQAWVLRALKNRFATV